MSMPGLTAAPKASTITQGVNLSLPVGTPIPPGPNTGRVWEHRFLDGLGLKLDHVSGDTTNVLNLEGLLREDPRATGLRRGILSAVERTAIESAILELRRERKGG